MIATVGGDQERAVGSPSPYYVRIDWTDRDDQVGGSAVLRSQRGLLWVMIKFLRVEKREGQKYE